MISKTEAEKTWTVCDATAFDEAETTIDVAIRKGEPLPIRVDLGKVRNWNPRVADRLIKAYEAGGWTITIEHGDQRDPGPFAVLR